MTLILPLSFFDRSFCELKGWEMPTAVIGPIDNLDTQAPNYDIDNCNNSNDDTINHLNHQS